MTNIKIKSLSLFLFLINFAISPSLCGLLNSKLSSNKNKISVFNFEEFEEIVPTNNDTTTTTSGEINKISILPKPAQFSCSLPKSLIEEIHSYQDIANKIIQETVNGSFKGRTYNELAFFVDKFGSRLFGTENLENSIDYMIKKMTQDNLEVHGEKVFIPKWIRGEESAEMLEPRQKKIAILGLGFSVGTQGYLTAEVLVVKSFDELREKAELAKDKIVIFNEPWMGYSKSVRYRGDGATVASELGAVAVLIRSVTPYSLYTLHTGEQDYGDNVTKIPAASITIEDAELLQRIHDRGEKIVIKLLMKDENFPETISRNVVANIKGREKPNEVVVISGHIDSWDVGQGALDDGGGAFISAEALALIKHLNLKTPRRTMRTILWTAEEPGLIGVQNYVKEHMNEMNLFNAVFESDIGTFKPLGLDFSGTEEASCIIQEVLKLLAPINATTLRKADSVGSDIGYFIDKGVPGLSLNTENSKYFYYHHTEADTMTVLNSDELDLCTAVWAVSSYIIADLSISLPRTDT